MNSLVRIGTRGSRLALTQARAVAHALGESSGRSTTIVEIQSTGDRLEGVPLGPSLGQSFFTKELEDALLEERIDLAVHSCKDLATSLPAGLMLAAVSVREDPSDALVSSAGGLRDLPPGAWVGTSSPRRKAFLRYARPDLTLVDQRGNVPTRLEAVDSGAVDAVVLAAAGLRRLGLADRITETLTWETLLPAAGQGALALEVRATDADALQVARILDDPAARAEVTAERACLHRLGAGCQAPIGVLGRYAAGTLTLRAALDGPGGVVRADMTGDASKAERMGVSVADKLFDEVGIGAHDFGWLRRGRRAS